MARILAADDQPHLTYIISFWLEKNGHEVVRVCDGAEALERLQTEQFDLLVTDVDMPRMDGLTLLGHREALEGLCGIVVLTSRDDYRELASSHCADRIEFLPKPFSPIKLAKLIENFLSERVSQAV